MSSVADYARFIRELARSPGDIGAVLPSGQALCARIAQCLAEHCPDEGVIVEFGPGLGSVTRAILDHGFDERRLRLIEFSAAFVKKLQKTYPAVQVIEGNAFRFVDYLEGAALSAVVSSLPTKLFSTEDREKLANDVLDHLMPGGLFIQFSYGRRPPFLFDGRDDITSHVTPWVLSNIPPARIWFYKKKLPVVS